MAGSLYAGGISLTDPQSDNLPFSIFYFQHDGNIMPLPVIQQFTCQVHGIADFAFGSFFKSFDTIIGKKRFKGDGGLVAADILYLIFIKQLEVYIIIKKKNLPVKHLLL